MTSYMTNRNICYFCYISFTVYYCLIYNWKHVPDRRRYLKQIKFWGIENPICYPINEYWFTLLYSNVASSSYWWIREVTKMKKFLSANLTKYAYTPTLKYKLLPMIFNFDTIHIFYDYYVMCSNDNIQCN